MNAQYAEEVVGQIVIPENFIDTRGPGTIVIDSVPYFVDPKFNLTIYKSDIDYLNNELTEEFFGKFCKDCGVENVDHKSYARHQFPFQRKKQERLDGFVNLSIDEGILDQKNKKTHLTKMGMESSLKEVRLSGNGLNKTEMYDNKLIRHLLEERLLTKNYDFTLTKEETRNLLKESKTKLELLKKRYVFEPQTELQMHFVRGFLKKKMRKCYDSDQAILVLGHYGLIDSFKDKNNIEKVIIH